MQYAVKIRSGNGKKKKEEKKKTILHSVNMKIYAGQVCAVMGSSGSGKSTLLDIISHISKRGVVSGSILMDGQPLPKYFKRIAGYVLTLFLNIIKTRSYGTRFVEICIKITKE